MTELDLFFRRMYKKVTRRSEPLFIGIDPGAEGAIALIRLPVYTVIDIPTLTVSRKKGNKKAAKTVFNEIAIVELFREIRRHKGFPIHSCVEEAQVQVKGRGGAYTAYRVACSYAMWSLFLLNFGWSVERVAPIKWKGAMGLIDKDKEDSRYKAMSLFPKAPLQWKKDHNRAEALLITEYFRRTFYGKL